MIGPVMSFATAILLNGIASAYFSWSNRGGSFSEDLPVPPLKKAVSTAAGATALTLICGDNSNASCLTIAETPAFAIA